MKHTQAFLDYKETLPKTRSGGVAWTIETYSKAVELLAPGYVVEAGQEWKGSKQPLWLVCPTHGRYQTQPNNFLTPARDTGCDDCSYQKKSDSAGITRSPRATEAERNEARRLYAELGNFEEIARRLKRNADTIITWCNPEYKEKKRRATKEWIKNNSERRKISQARYRQEYSHGIAIRGNSRSLRRKQKLGEVEWVDEVAGLVNLLPMKATGEDLTKEQAFYIECARITKETGIPHHVDHIWPLSKGGQHIFYNLQVITAEENLKKHDRYNDEDKALYAMRVAMLFTGEI